MVHCEWERRRIGITALTESRLRLSPLRPTPKIEKEQMGQIFKSVYFSHQFDKLLTKVKPLHPPLMIKGILNLNRLSQEPPRTGS